MHAQFYEPLPDSSVDCHLCHHGCRIPPGESGTCGVRRNTGGRLEALTYGRASAVNLDPIEKKPLFHFLPGTASLSLGTLGCNFTCSFCQNCDISQPDVPVAADPARGTRELPPRQIVTHCIENSIPSVSFTYNEPTVFLEYALDTATMAKVVGLRTVFVSNGFMSDRALAATAPFLDAINIDLKSGDDAFYRRFCGARLAPVLGNIARARELGIWVEVTTLVIEGLNDSAEDLDACARFIAGVDPSIPWHLTAFHPDHLMTDLPHTRPEALCRARELGLEAGLKHVYTGNIIDPDHAATYCPECQTRLIRRSGHVVEISGLQDGRCENCGEEIPGVWV